jgi:hypothetical protein
MAYVQEQNILLNSQFKILPIVKTYLISSFSLAVSWHYLLR